MTDRKTDIAQRLQGSCCYLHLDSVLSGYRNDQQKRARNDSR
jgi:hypothetical protein